MNIWQEKTTKMLPELKKLCDNCLLCGIGRVKARDQEDPHVLSNLNPSRYMLIAQNPGWNEVLLDSPLVGQSGQTLNEELEKNGLNRSKFYIGNVVRCFTENNRIPTKEEIQNCSSYLRFELQILKPRLVVTLGRLAFKAFCPKEDYSPNLGKIVKSRIFTTKQINIFPVYHPSGMNLTIKERRIKFEKDIKMLCALVKKLDEEFNSVSGLCINTSS